MNPLDTFYQSQNLMTHRLPWATRQYQDLANKLGLNVVSNNLIEVSLNTLDSKFLCGILSFLKQPEIIKLCNFWGNMEYCFVGLARIGEAILYNPKLYKDLGGVDHSNEISRIYRGDVRECYIPAMLACPPPELSPELELQVQVHPNWVQAFRLWLLYLSLQANSSGIPSETHLKIVCTEVRLLCEGPTTAAKRDLFRHLSTIDIPQSAIAFKASLQLKVNEYLSAVARNPSGSFDQKFTALVKNDLSALFNHQFEPVPIPQGKEYGIYRFTPEIPLDSKLADPSESEPSNIDSKDLEDLVQEKVAGLDNVRGVRTHPDSTPEAQERASEQVQLLSREDGLMLPWSWHRLCQAEKSEFFGLISILRTEKSFTSNLAAAIATVAILTSTSGRQVDEIEISDQLTDAWTLHLNQFTLSRRPPRKSNGWTPKDLGPDQATKWLVQTAEHWAIELDEPLIKAFSKAIGRVGGAKNLGALWKATGEKGNFADWFNARLAGTTGLDRLTAPILATITRQESFVQIQDHVLARVISSNPATALPAAAAYGAYSGNTITKVFTPVLTTLSAQIATAYLPHNWAGSQLEVLEEHLKEQLERLERRIDNASKQEDDWVGYHNLLVTYVVLALLAVTGARPVNSPFESVTWFDFNRKLVFVDDKAGGMARASRLCILTDTTIALLQKRYLPHLQNLADGLRAKLPDFASQIAAVLAGSDSASLPLFFFISNSPNFDWLEVTESGLAMQCGVDDWPIPFNFLRHRFSTRLRKLHLDIEIIEALMGHGDAGCESHGAYSLRVLSDDLATARPLVAKITDELQLKIPSECQLNCHSVSPPLHANFFGYTRKFGNKARAQQRHSGHERTKQIAMTDIDLALNGRNPKTLSAEDWDAIGLKMVVHESSRMPYPFGALRYDVFQQYLRTIWKEFGIKPKIKRRFLLDREGTPTITEKSVYAPPLILELRRQFENACKALEETTLRPMIACMLAALDACLNSNIADSTVLISLACHANVVPVYFDKKAYIEHHTATVWKDGKPARRFPVSHRCIRHLLIGLNEQKARHKLPGCPPKLSALPALLGLPTNVEFGKLLKKIATLVAETNCYHFSGLQAAILDGRIHVSALPHHDWVRAQKLKRPILGEQTNEVPEITATDESFLTKSTAKGSAIGKEDSEDLPKASRKLFRAIRKVIASDLPPSKKTSDIQILLDESTFEPGDLVYALGEWGAHNLERPANTKTEKLKKSSAETYFNELAGRVASVASAQQLSECDDDELLEVYRNILQPSDAAPLNSEEVASIGGRDVPGENGSPTSEDIREGEPQTVDATVIQQLMDFHEWAAVKYGLEDPDFSELGEFEFAAVGRPGIVSEGEYLWCLQQLTSSESLRDVSRDNLSAAMVMVLAYRFGLRSREAMGIYRADWVDAGEALVVLVQSNYLRGLKNLQSKRQIPRLEPLTPLERQIEEEIRRRWDEREGKNTNTPLLADLNLRTFKHFCIGIRAKLLALLKVATGNSRATVHHLRHSFASHTLATISGHYGELGPEVTESPVRSINLRKLLLCNEKIDRRAVWAVCRLMGHSSPATLLKAYFHGQLLPSPTTELSPILTDDELRDSHLVNLDMVEFAADYLPSLSKEFIAGADVALPRQTLESRVNYMRLRAIGFPVHRAAFTVGMPILEAQHFEEYVSCAVNALVPMHKGEARMTSLEHLVRKIAAIRWRPLLESGKKSNGEALVLTGDLDVAPPETIASHRHLLLFREEHLVAFSNFCRDLDLKSSDIRLLRTLQMSEYMVDLHKRLGLSVYSKSHLVNKSNAARISNVVTAISPDNPQRVRYLDRWGVFCEPGRKFSDNFELMLLWMCWASRAALDIN